MNVEKKVVKHSLSLSRAELVHLRDIMGVCVPSETGQTLSAMLAASEGRETVDASLWEKVSTLCKTAGVHLEDEAPDYVISPVSIPMMSIFRLQSDEELEAVTEQTKDNCVFETSKVESDEQKISCGSSAVRCPEQADAGDTLPSRRRAKKKDAKRR